MRGSWIVLGVACLGAVGCGEESDSGAAQGTPDAGEDASAGSGGAGGAGVGGGAGAAGQASGGGAGQASGGAYSVGPDGLFLSDYVYYKDVSQLPASPESDAILQTLEDLGGWGADDTFAITFDFDVFEADSSTPTAVLDDVLYDTHSDPGPFPVVPGGAVEGMDDYYCPGDVGDHDCHYLVVQQDQRILYEVYAASELSPGHFRAGGMAKWYLDSHYGDTQRGFGCSSADAAGLPIVPGLVRVKEVVTDQEIKHALRFILPNARMRYRSLVAPATHFGAPSSDEPNAPPYGVRFRLKASFDENTVDSPGGKVIVRALKKYGMLLADGGQIALTAQRDRFTSAKWDGVLAERDLDMLEVTDFEVVDFGIVQSFDEYPECDLHNPP